MLKSLFEKKQNLQDKTSYYGCCYFQSTFLALILRQCAFIEICSRFMFHSLNFSPAYKILYYNYIKISIYMCKEEKEPAMGNVQMTYGLTYLQIGRLFLYHTTNNTLSFGPVSTSHLILAVPLISTLRISPSASKRIGRKRCVSTDVGSKQ